MMRRHIHTVHHHKKAMRRDLSLATEDVSYSLQYYSLHRQHHPIDIDTIPFTKLLFTMPPKPRRTNNKKKKCSKNSSSSSSNHANVAAAAAAAPQPRPSAFMMNARGCRHGAPEGNFEDPRLNGVKTILQSFDRYPKDPGVGRALMMVDEYPGCNNEYTVQVLVSLGTKQILEEEDDEKRAESYAQTILFLEEIRRTSAEKATSDQFRQGVLDLDSRRNLVKFFRKRIPCNCLDDEWEALKDERTGKCTLCSKTAEDASLFNCSKCGLIKYCSKDCQVKDWPDHKSLCKELRGKKQFLEATEDEDDEDLERMSDLLNKFRIGAEEKYTTRHGDSAK